MGTKGSIRDSFAGLRRQFQRDCLIFLVAAEGECNRSLANALYLVAAYGHALANNCP